MKNNQSLFHVRLNIAIITFLWCIPTLSTIDPQIDNYNYQNDYQGMIALIKEEWPKLFLQPEYDCKIVNKMLLQNVPGNIAYQDKKLFIKVLRDEDKITGFATYYYPNATIGHIELLAVNKFYRSRGLGKKLIEYVTAEVARQGAKTLQLYVYTNNSHAIKFYTHLGFSVKSNYPGYILLSKPIKDQNQ